MSDELGLSPAQAEAVERLQRSLQGIGAALLGCHAAGLEPTKAFEAAGIELPAIMRPMGPMINRAISGYAAEAAA